MSQTTISIRVDKSLKQSFDSLCNAFGLSATAAFNIFMKAVVRERRIPFDIKIDSNDKVKLDAMSAFIQMQKTASEKFPNGLTLDEINEEIRCVRNEIRKNSIRSN